MILVSATAPLEADDERRVSAELIAPVVQACRALILAAIWLAGLRARAAPKSLRTAFGGV
ncbi:hypothetical protein ASE02_11660 [Phenylobacterium sp. Root700]|nr:hypothetical protein ASE02_11660 [Phenylobacterium sp. Root700]